MSPEREQWRSYPGFVLATIGSAVGLGNIWRFSYVAGENGGGAFLLLYLVCALLVGVPLIIAELALGRQAQGDAVSAFEKVAPRSPWLLGGWLGVLAAFLILSYYAVIAGWTLKYFAGALTGALWEAAAGGYGGYFRSFIAQRGEPVIWQFVMLAASMAIVSGGVRGGIEALNRWLMPLLALMVIGLAIHSLSLPGSGPGWRFLLLPDWQALARPEVYVAALGQAFFSIGIGMAIFITYGSYMTRAFPIPVSASAIIVGDSLFAIMAGLAIFPAVFALGMDPAAGPELAFITLPQLFLAMPGGQIVGLVFFLLLVAAALTSMISLLEVPVAFALQRLGLPRKTAVLAVGAAIFAVGVPSAMSYGLLAGLQFDGRGILDSLDQAVSSYLLPLSGILLAIFVGWRWRKGEALREADLAPDSAFASAWIWLVRIVAPAAMSLILIRNLAEL